MLLRRTPSLPNWSVGLRDFDDMRRDMDRLFSAWTGLAAPRNVGLFPAMNVSEDGDAVYVRAEMPGVKAEDLDLSIEKDTLTIAGERRSDDGEGVSFHRREREWGAFRRSFTLPTPVESDNVKANYTDGILTVTLPKAAEARPRQITVQASA